MDMTKLLSEKEYDAMTAKKLSVHHGFSNLSDFVWELELHARNGFTWEYSNYVKWFTIENSPLGKALK